MARSSSPSPRSSSGPGSRESTAPRRRDTASLISSLREGASPSQNGIEGGWPFASATRTTPLPIFRIRQDVLPSWKTSPGSDSMAKSSFSVPTTWPSGSSTTLKSNTSGMAPPFMMAVMREPLRARSFRLSESWWISAARRPRLVAKPCASISTTSVYSARSSVPIGIGAGAPGRTSRPRPTPPRRRSRPRSAGRARRAAASGMTTWSSSPSCTARTIAAHSTRSSRVSGKTRPLGTPPMMCPERPTRCRNVAMRCGEEIWQTRSTWPMSMPSSREAVATTTLSLPSRSRCSASRRASFERLPWCAATNSAPSRSESWCAMRSASRRVFTVMSVVRCDSMSSTSRS